MNCAKADGRLYILSSPKDLLEPGTYDAQFIDKARSIRVRNNFDGKHMDIRLAIDSVIDQPREAAPAAAVRTDGVVTPVPEPQTAEKFVISPNPSSHLGVCIEVMTYRDGSQQCMKWADRK